MKNLRKLTQKKYKNIVLKAIEKITHYSYKLINIINYIFCCINSFSIMEGV